MNRVYIAIVSNRDHKAMFTGALYALTQHITHQGMKYGVERHAVSVGSGHSCLSMGRQEALEMARKHNFTHVLFIDDDMVFAPNLLQQLISHKVGVVGANAMTKDQRNSQFVVRGMDGERLSSKGKKGIEEVTRHGMGVMLVEMAAISHVAVPHFEVVWKNGSYVSEDNYFCDKLREHGVKIYTDHDAAQQIGHVGDYVYAMNG
jgi:hypothetical protein